MPTDETVREDTPATEPRKWWGDGSPWWYDVLGTGGMYKAVRALVRRMVDEARNPDETEEFPHHTWAQALCIEVLSCLPTPAAPVGSEAAHSTIRRAHVMLDRAKSEHGLRRATKGEREDLLSDYTLPDGSGFTCVSPAPSGAQQGR
jgi:hypothetical protein